MKIIIVSDSHSNVQNLKEIRTRHLEEANLFLHCGDSQLFYDHPIINGFLSVAGNCDYDRNYPKEITQELTEKDTLFMTHGHLYDVKMSLERLRYKALEVGANIVCFGHSHCIAVEMIHGILFVNPGSVIFPRNTKEKTYACLTIHQNLLEVKILNVVNGNVLFEYKFER